MDYSSGVVASRGPGRISLNVLEDVYAHIDSWNSFELVEPTRDQAEPVSEVTELETVNARTPATYLATPVTAMNCSTMGDENSCKSQNKCKWRKDECIINPRRLEEPGCDYPYHPTEFDIPASAELLACTSNTVTFELVEDNIATRFNVVLSHRMRRKRQLLGSW